MDPIHAGYRPTRPSNGEPDPGWAAPLLVAPTRLRTATNNVQLNARSEMLRNRTSPGRQRLLDRAPNETLDNYRDEGTDAGRVELPVCTSYPSLEVRSGDPFGRVTPLQAPGDLSDLVIGAGFIRLDAVYALRVPRSAIRTQLGSYRNLPRRHGCHGPYMEEPQASHVGPVVADVSIMDSGRQELSSSPSRAN
jgi:hypothetical protein